MRQHYRGGKLLFALTVVVGLSVLLGGCVAFQEKLVPATGRMAPLGNASIQPQPGPGRNPILACGLQEISPKEADFDLDAFWKDSQIAALQEQLERRELKLMLGTMRLFSSKFVQLGFVPFGAEAGIAFEERAGQRQAIALIKQEDGTLNVYPDGREELWALLNAQAVQELVESLRKQGEFQAFEKELFAQGKQISAQQSLGVTTNEKGLLYLAVAEGLTVQSVVMYYRVELSISEREGYRMQGAPRELCVAGEYSKLGFRDGALMSLVGAYETRSGEVKVVQQAKDPCLFGLSGLACLDMRHMSQWLARLRERFEEEKEQNLQNLLEAHNLLAGQEYYSMVYAWDRLQRRSDFAVAGFPNMSSQEFESLWDLAQGVLDSASTSDPVVDKKIKQSMEMLNTINLGDLDRWMEALKEALEQGRFDAEYAQLLTKGLDRYRDIFVTVWGYSAEEAKNLIRDMATTRWSLIAILDQQQLSKSQKEAIKKAMREAELALKLAYAALQGLSTVLGLLHEIINVLGIEGLSNVTPWGLVDLMLARWEMAIRVMVSNGFDPNEAVLLSYDIRRLVEHFSGRIVLNSLWRVGELAKFLDWMSSVSDSRRSISERIEQGVGTIRIAANAVGKGWSYVQLRLDLAGIYTRHYGDWWGAALLLSRKESVSGRSIAALVRGSICIHCEDRVREIEFWVDRALSLLPGLQSSTRADVGVVGLVFTNRLATPTGIGDVINALYARFDSRENAAIIVVWIDKYGRVWYTCIGGGCSALKPKEAEQIACNLVGRNAGCGARSIINGPNSALLDLLEPKSPVIVEPVNWFEVDPCAIWEARDMFCR